MRLRWGQRIKMSDTKFANIAAVVADRIAQGVYPAKAKLPPHRKLAQELDTTPTTVAKAYNVLAEQGLVESFVGRGSFVKPQSHLRRVIQPQQSSQGYNFSILQPCLSESLAAVQKAYRQTSGQLSASVIGYADSSGHIQHRDVAAMWAAHFGLSGGNGSNTLLTNGAQHALSVLIQALTEPGAVIVTEALTYPGIIACANIHGRELVGVAMDEQGMIPEALDDALQRTQASLVIAIPSYQNPTGITMGQARREQIAAVIEKHQVWLVEDDIYGFLNNQAIPAMTNYVPNLGFHVTALSKAISPAMRCGFIKAPQSQVERLNTYLRADSWLASPINHDAASWMIASHEAFDIAAKQRDIAHQRQGIFRQYFPLNTAVDNGYHVWLPVTHQWNAYRLTQAASRQNMIISDGNYFAVNGDGQGFVRLSLMSIDSVLELHQGLSALKTLIETDANPA